MIKHLRIDNRLIHSQVTHAWKDYIGAEVMIACNDKVAIDPLYMTALPMAAMGMKVLVCSIEDTIKYVKENPEVSTFVICKHPEDALALLESDIKIEDVNVGNAAPIMGTRFVMVTETVAATEEDAEIYRKIADKCEGKLYWTYVPDSEPVDFLNALIESGL